MIRPLGKNILIQKLEKKSKSGLIVPDIGEPFNAVVIDMGGKVDLEISVSDILLVVPYAGSRISAEDDGFLLITEKDILGVVHDNSNHKL